MALRSFGNSLTFRLLLDKCLNARSRVIRMRSPANKGLSSTESASHV